MYLEKEKAKSGNETPHFSWPINETQVKFETVLN